MKNKEQKERMEEFLGRIFGASNEEYLKRVWFEGRGPECEDFDEFVNYYFDESTSILKRYKDYEISETQYYQLKAFEDELRKFAYSDDSYLLSQEFLNSPNWKKIMNMAKEILKSFNFQPPIKN